MVSHVNVIALLYTSLLTEYVYTQVDYVPTDLMAQQAVNQVSVNKSINLMRN